ncbi:MAG: hypothetical protein LCH61_19750, partial [Proteobacteria bacterium]|nr:hypothetical protein [Pseudomonadota bacterium]
MKDKRICSHEAMLRPLRRNQLYKRQSEQERQPLKVKMLSKIYNNELTLIQGHFQTYQWRCVVDKELRLERRHETDRANRNQHTHKPES